MVLLFDEVKIGLSPSTLSRKGKNDRQGEATCENENKEGFGRFQMERISAQQVKSAKQEDQ